MSAPSDDVASTPCPVDRAQVKKAVTSLLSYLDSQRPASRDLLQSDGDSLFVTSEVHRIPETPALMCPTRIPVPHTVIHPSDEDICLIVRSNLGPTRAEVSRSLPEIKKVLDVKKIRENYSSYESRRKLAGSYTLFLVESRAYPLLPSLLGKTFFDTKKKAPIPVRIDKKIGLSKSVMGALEKATYLRVRRGKLSSVAVGSTSRLGVKEIVENVVEACKGLTRLVGGGDWENVKMFSLGSGKTLGLPLPFYNTLPRRTTVGESDRMEEERMERKKEGRKFVDEVDEAIKLAEKEYQEDLAIRRALGGSDADEPEEDEDEEDEGEGEDEEDDQ